MNKFYPTRAQLETLLRDFEPCGYPYDDQFILHSEGDHLVVQVRLNADCYARYIDRDGNILRHDAEIDELVRATAEPLLGTYRVGQSRDVTYAY